jgi:chromosome segregation ATPase
MDHRKKSIGGLERKKQESRGSLDLILEDFGGQLLERIGGEDFPSGELEEYRRLLKEVGDSEALIKTIEADTRRLRDLEEEINRREEQQAARSRELSGLYITLAGRVLEENQSGDMAAAYRQRADLFADKIESLESRLADLEAGEGTGLFAWLEKNIRGSAARSSLTRARNNLDKLYEEAGEQFSQPNHGGPPFEGEAAGLVEAIKKTRALSQTRAGELAELREERRKLGGVFGAEGGPAKQIQGLERHIGHIRQELKAVYRRFGEQASAGENKKRFASLFHEDDKQVLDKIRLIRKTIRDYEGEIKKLKTSLEIDAEKGEIEKLKKAVEEQRGRIAAAEENIAELNGCIHQAEKHIEELEKLL